MVCVDMLFTIYQVLIVFSAKSAASPCASKVVTDASVYMWNDNYPSAMQPEHNGCTCSIETSCDTHIQITALDVRLIETGGECQQGIVITDDGQSTVIGCEANNNYRAKTVYTSTSSFIILELDNMMTKDNGYFWFHITGKPAISNTNRNLKLFMGLVTTYPAFRVSEKGRFKPISSALETSWEIEIWLSHWYPGSGVVLDCIDS